METENNFKQAMQAAGIETKAHILADGTLHRFHVTGDRIGSKNGWYVLHTDDMAAGQFGCFKRGISKTWSARADATLTQEEKARFAVKMEKTRRQRDAETAKLQAECRAWCAERWQQGKPATDAYSYLKRRGVHAYGLRLLHDSLMIPLYDTAGTIHGMQFIGPDGDKRFKVGTAKLGHYFPIGTLKENTLLICEGYATGASLHEATGQAVAVAFDAGNLKSVAKALRKKYPDTLLVICGDDDHQTEGNPGLTAATETARAVSGVLVVPTFPNTRGPKDTDFNDMARMSGQDAVKACIKAATIPFPSSAIENVLQENPLEAAVRRLAALSSLEYDRVRKAEAKTLCVRQATLDAAVKDTRKGCKIEDLPFQEVDPWPEPVDPARLLTDISRTVRRFIVCAAEVAHAAALWVAMTWFIDVVHVAPLAVITAPEKRCGKTLLLNLLGKLSARAVTASNISPAALFRTIDAWHPTLLIDEVDAFMKDNEELRGLINSGHTRDSAYVVRTVGENFIPTKFSTWGPKALSGIGHVADTLMDRAVVLELRRKLPHEEVERIRHAEPGLFDELQAKLARFSEDYSEKVKQSRPPLPHSLNDRAQDNWETLLAIAMTAGDEWLQRGTSAALKLSGGESASQTIGAELLSDIQEIFEDKQVDKISTAEIIVSLCSDDEKPWASYNRGKPMTPRQLSKKLKEYGITSKTIRLGSNETPKGFERHQFEDVFSRYLSPENNRHTPQTMSALGLRENDVRNISATCTPYPPHATKNVPSVADDPSRCGYEKESATPNHTNIKKCCVVADKKVGARENNLREVQI